MGEKYKINENENTMLSGEERSGKCATELAKNRRNSCAFCACVYLANVIRLSSLISSTIFGFHFPWPLASSHGV